MEDGRVVLEGTADELARNQDVAEFYLGLSGVGDKRRFWIPGRLAYGDQPGKPHGMLVYDIDLVQFVD